MTTGLTPGNYVLSGGAAVSLVTLSANSKVAYLTTGGLTPGQRYTLTVTGVKDMAEVPNTMPSSGRAAWAPVLAPGLVWDFYPGVANGIGNLTGNMYYPAAPDTTLGVVTNYNSAEITGGDLNNRPGFTGGRGDGYGSSLSGWITPTVSGSYYFYISSDDASELLLSTDATTFNAVTIATEPTCCRPFSEPTSNTTTSVAIPLTAGQSYFIRALQTEGAGGDYVKVAWKLSTDTTAATNLVPISTSVLKAYVPVPPLKFNPTVYSGGQVTVSWTGFGTLYESTDFVTWTPVTGNPPSPYTFTPTVPRKFYRLEL